MRLTGVIRLAHLFITTALFQYASTALAENHSAWWLDSSVDQMTDEPIMVSHTNSKSTNSPSGSPQTLYISCKSGNLSIYIDWGEFVSSYGSTISLRFDKRGVQEVSYEPSTNYMATFFEEGSSALTFLEFVSAGRKYNTLLAKVTPHGENPRIAKFSLLGFSETALVTASKCGYDRHYEGRW